MTADAYAMSGDWSSECKMNVEKLAREWSVEANEKRQE